MGKVGSEVGPSLLCQFWVNHIPILGFQPIRLGNRKVQLYSGRALPNDQVPVTVQDTTTNSRLLHRAMQLEMEHVL